MCYLFAESIEPPTTEPLTEYLSNIEAQISMEFRNGEKIRVKSTSVKIGPKAGNLSLINGVIGSVVLCKVIIHKSRGEQFLWNKNWEYE